MMTLESVPSMYLSRDTFCAQIGTWTRSDEESRLETYHRPEVIVGIRFRPLCRSLEEAIFDEFQGRFEKLRFLGPELRTTILTMLIESIVIEYSNCEMFFDDRCKRLTSSKLILAMTHCQWGRGKIKAKAFWSKVNFILKLFALITR